MLLALVGAGALVYLATEHRAAGPGRPVSPDAETSPAGPAKAHPPPADQPPPPPPAVSPHQPGETPPMPAATATGPGKRGSAQPPRKANGDTRPTTPPGLNEPSRPHSMVAQARRMIKDALRQSGPDALTLGKQLLEADTPELRSVGAAILGELDALDDEALRQIARDADLSVPLNTLGYMHDHGQAEGFGALADLLPEGSLSGDNLVSLIEAGHIDGAGIRVALDLLHASADPSDNRALYSALTADAAQQYSVRMKAVLLMRDTMEFTAYRQAVHELLANAGGDDALWHEGLSRLANRLEGPVPIHTATPALTSNDIDERLAREFPMTVEDLAQHVEYLLNHDDAYIQSGTADRLAQRLAELNQRPWTTEQQVGLSRLEASVPALRAREDPDAAPPAALAQPPPGAGS